VIKFNSSSSTLSSKQIRQLSRLGISKVSKVVITGYVQATRNASNDRALSLTRAKQVASQVKKLDRNVQIKTRAAGSKKQPLCSGSKNRCVVMLLKP
jgi:outer membrane protein OmpA-like peptidoglycan-associated protein